jgi:hypothetical protein
MKTYCVVYLPHHKEDKEWVNFEAESPKDVKERFKGGVIVSIELAGDD